MPLTIRRAEAGDAAALARVHIASWRAAYASILPTEVLAGLQEDEFTARWRRNLQSDQPIKIVVEEEGVPCGFAAYGTARDEDTPAGFGEIYSLYLHPNCWSRGWGRTLMERTLLEMAPLYQGATLWVLRDNERAIRFYRQTGFHTDGHMKEITLFGVTLPEVRYVLRF